MAVKRVVVISCNLIPQPGKCAISEYRVNARKSRTGLLRGASARRRSVEEVVDSRIDQERDPESRDRWGQAGFAAKDVAVGLGAPAVLCSSNIPAGKMSWRRTRVPS
jgi:hypothetical protein